MTPTAGATEQRPTHYITLSDGSDTIGIIPVDAQGRDNPLAIQRSRYPRMATHISQGHSQYEDVNPPYRPIVQDNWQSGRGEDDFEKDTERYLDGYRANTEHENQVILGGLETYHTGHLTVDQDMPGNVSFGGLYSGTLYKARKFTTSSAYTANKVMLWIRRIGSPGGTINVEIWSDSGGSPNAIVAGGASATLAVSSITDVASELRVFELGTPPSLSGSTSYWVVVYISGSTPDATDHISVGRSDSSGNSKDSSDGSSWSSAPYDMYFRVLDDTEWRGKFLEYKRGLYFLSQPLNADDSKLYLNGDRGIATGGTASTLADTDQTWTTNEWAGATVLIIKGTGVDQRQPWRTISSNTGTALTISPNWDINPASGTEYVILGSNKWQLWHDLSEYATDAVVAGDGIYVAFGDRGVRNVALYMEWRNGSATTYTQSQITQTMEADKLLAIRHPSQGTILWGSVNEDEFNGVAVWKALIPPLYDVSPANSQLYSNRGTLLELNDVWDEQSISNVTVSRYQGRMQIAIGASFTTGLIASKRLDNPVDITTGTNLAFLVHSTDAANAGDLRLRIDDTPFLGDSYLADKVWLWDPGSTPEEVVWYDGTNYINLYNLFEDDLGTSLIKLETTHYLFVGFSFPPDSVYVDVVAANATASTLSMDEFLGGNDDWTSISITDGTKTGGDTTFGQDGEITWTRVTTHSKGTPTADLSNLNQNLYWLRFSVSANLDATTRIYSIEASGTEPFSHPRYVDLGYVKDGFNTTLETPRINSDKKIIVMHSSKFDGIYWELGTAVNAVTATMTAQYFDGRDIKSLTITDGTASGGVTLAQDGEMTFTIPDDWEQIEIEGETGYIILLSPSADLAPASGYVIEIEEIYVNNDDYTEINFPALTAGAWNWVTFSISPNKTPNPDDTQINSIGIYLNTDLGSQTLKFGSHIYIIEQRGDFIPIGNSDSRIIGLEAYGDERQNPWIFKEDELFEIQTENNDLPVPIPLRELRSMSSELNGVAHTVSDVYLVFNLDRHIERYYNRTLEDFGFDKDEGLPSTRQGTVSDLLSYPGRIYGSVDAGDSGYSSILVRRGGGWHEVYRAPKGERIHKMAVQVIPGLISRLYASQGSDIISLPLPKESFNPTQDSNYEYTHESYIITGWVSANFLDINKLFKSVKLYTENLSGTSQYIKVEYQTETGTLTTGWTEVTSSFSTSPFEENDIASANNITARRIRFRITLYTDDYTTTPILKASVIEALQRLGIKYQYVVRFRLEDSPADLGKERDFTVRIEDITSILETWADAPTALTFRCPYSPYDNKNVILEFDGMQPLELDTEQQTEKHYASITLLEI